MQNNKFLNNTGFEPVNLNVNQTVTKLQIDRRVQTSLPTLYKYKYYLNVN